MTRFEREMDGRLELNMSFDEIQEAFKDVPVKPVKISRKFNPDGEYIEIAFVTPEVGNRYCQLIRELEEWTLWDIRVKSTPNNAVITEICHDLSAGKFELLKNPSIRAENKTVNLYIDRILEDRQREDLCEQFYIMTGYTLSFSNGIKA